MIRTHILGKARGQTVHQTYSFYVEDDNPNHIRIVENHIENGSILNAPKLQRDVVSLRSPSNEVHTISVNGREYIDIEVARHLYRHLLEWGFTPYTA